MCASVLLQRREGNHSLWINKSNLSSAADCYTTTLKILEISLFMRLRSRVGCLTCSLEESKLLQYFYLISFVVVKSPVIDDGDMFSPANQFKRRWRMETEVAGEKQLISLPSARVTGAWSCHFHSLRYLLFSSVHNSIHTSLLRSTLMLDLCPDLQTVLKFILYACDSCAAILSGMISFVSSV